MSASKCFFVKINHSKNELVKMFSNDVAARIKQKKEEEKSLIGSARADLTGKAPGRFTLEEAKKAGYTIHKVPGQKGMIGISNELIPILSLSQNDGKPAIYPVFMNRLKDKPKREWERWVDNVPTFSGGVVRIDL
jgi:hypothetical protein